MSRSQLRGSGLNPVLREMAIARACGAGEPEAAHLKNKRALVEFVKERNGVELDTGGVGVYLVVDGRITDVWVIHEDQAAADRFFG